MKCEFRLALVDTLQNGSVHRRLEIRPPFIRRVRNERMVLLASIARVIVSGNRFVLAGFEDVTEQRRLGEQFRQSPEDGGRRTARGRGRA